MAMTHSEMDRRIDEHFGFEANDDVEGVLATLAPDAEHDIVGWPSGPTRGRSAARPFYEALFDDLADGEVKSLRRLYGDDFLVDETIWHGFVKDGRPFLCDGRSGPVSFRILHVFRFEKGKISAEQAWLDLAAIQSQL